MTHTTLKVRHTRLITRDDRAKSSAICTTPVLLSTSVQLLPPHVHHALVAGAVRKTHIVLARAKLKRVCDSDSNSVKR